MADRARQVAWRTLQAVSNNEAYANLVLPGLLDERHLEARDAALATELGYGTLRTSGVLDEVLARCATRPLADIESGVLDLLRLGAYQLLRTRIPAHAAVASTVELSRSVGHARSAGFINAILRKVSAHDYEQWCERIAPGASELGRLSLRYAHPGWIVGSFAAALGTDGHTQLAEALAADDERPVTHLVAYPDGIERPELAEAAAGEPGPYSPFAVRLSHGGRPGALAAVREHRAGVQDEGSQLCAWALTRLPVASPAAGERWLDLCAGPGGKAALLAALASGHGARLIANELHPHRAELVRQALAGRPVEVTVGDARDFAARTGGTGFDRILLDAPCTGLGALRRRPEARWRKGPDDLDALLPLQAALLDAAADLLRPGGVLGYVTCSPHPAETVDQVRAVLDRRTDLELVDAAPAFGVPDAAVTGLDGAVQLWPHRHGTDAMFFAGLRRR